MIEQSQSFKQLVKNLQAVPYLASKNLYRVINYFLSQDDLKIEQFCKAIIDAKNNIVKCTVCCSWKEVDQHCFFCDPSKRDVSLVCVVETWQELLAIEKTGGYQGSYHILGGSICPLEGIGPSDLSIDVLLTRIKDPLKEVILATNQTPEGETTAAFIAEKLKNEKNIKISCLAKGIPVGSSLEFMDKITVYKALSERRLF